MMHHDDQRSEAPESIEGAKPMQRGGTYGHHETTATTANAIR